MCGIAGFLTPRGIDRAEARDVLHSMTSAVCHRGPDDAGEWLDANAGVALGHRRLSVIDLTAAGHQPRISPSERYVLVFNGEIYNHLELRRRLEPCRWEGHSDTETLLVGIERWGLDETLRRAVGMFALALWDRSERVLSLARDRMGEKPLYYGWQGRSFLFGSELKSLRRHPEFVGGVDRRVLTGYVRRGYVTGESTIHTGLYRVPPGAIVQVEARLGASAPAVKRTYWSLSDVVIRAAANRFAGSPDEAVRALEMVLRRAVTRQQLADVPLGAFLSGGIDSSTIVALLRATASGPVRTYTIGFSEQRYDEAAYARAVAAHLGTHHTELYVTPQDALDLIPRLPQTFDEPFADLSQLPTMLVAQLARRDVTVALSGDAGDELFGGYGRYPETVAQWARVARLPWALRRAAAALLRRSVYGEGLAARDIDTFYQYLHASWKGAPAIVLGETAWLDPVDVPSALSAPEERLMFADAVSYLPDDILVKVDRAAMATSLETRVPLLDHEVVEFAWSLPLAIKRRHGVGKWPLKQLLYRYVPPSLVDRPKMGFGVPLEHWLRGPLRAWAEDLLSPDRLRGDGIFDPAPIRRYWREHIDGTRDRHYGLWNILMFQAWHDTIRRERGSS